MQKLNSSVESTGSNDSETSHQVIKDVKNEKLGISRNHFGFAQFVRDKNNYDFNEKFNKLNDKSSNTYIYGEKLSLNTLEPDLMIFKNYWLKKTSLIKATMEDVSGLLTVKDYSEGLTRYNP